MALDKRLCGIYAYAHCSKLASAAPSVRESNLDLGENVAALATSELPRLQWPIPRPIPQTKSVTRFGFPICYLPLSGYRTLSHASGIGNGVQLWNCQLLARLVTYRHVGLRALLCKQVPYALKMLSPTDHAPALSQALAVQNQALSTLGLCCDYT